MGLLNSAVLVVLVCLVAAAVVLILRTSRYRGLAAEPADIDLSRYEPMARLLDPAEVAFLAEQPGITPQQLREFQQSRRSIFRRYLRELSADYHTLHREARQLVAASPEENSELVSMLFRQQVNFWLTMLRIETQLILAAAGLGHVDPRRLLDGVSELHAAVLRSSTPGPIRVR